MSDFFSNFGIGDLLGTAASLFSGSKDRSAAKNAAYLGSLRGLVDQARAVGISPLAALGFSGYQPTLIGGQSELGSTIKDILARQHEKELNKPSQADSDLKKAQKDLLEAQREEVLSRIERERLAATPARWYPFTAQDIHQQTRAAIPTRYIPVRDNKTGKIYLEANPDVYELPEFLGAGVAIDARLKDVKNAKRRGRHGRNKTWRDR